MTAQPLNRALVPTISQRRALAADHANRYAEVQVEEAPKVVGASMENRVIGYFAVAVACLFLVAHFWGLA